MPAINAQGQTAFRATLTTKTNNVGIWAESGTDSLTLNLVAQVGEPAPDATGTQVTTAVNDQGIRLWSGSS